MPLARWGTLGGSVVVVATIALGRLRVLPADVAVGAVKFAVDFIQFQSGHIVGEILLVPAGMTTDALAVQPRDLLARRMTGAAIEILVESIERPTGDSVCEGRFLLGVVTLGAVIGLVAVATDRVYFHLRLLDFFRRFQIVAIRAVFLLVAVDTLQAEQFDMLFVKEGHDRTAGVRSPIDPRIGYSDDRVGDAHHVGRVGRHSLHHLAGLRSVADCALGVVAPLTVAIETLTMIRSLKAGLPEIIRIPLAAMALFARRNSSRWREVVAGLAV